MHLYPAEILYIFALGILLYLVLKKQLFDPIGKILKDREETVENANSFIADATEEIESLKNKRDKGISKATTEAYEIGEKARSEGGEKRKEIITSAREDAYDKLKQTRSEIRKRSDEVKKTLQKEADKFARDIASRLLGREI